MMHSRARNFILTLLITFFVNNASATPYTFVQAIELYEAQGLKQPTPDPDGRVQTLNDKGAMAAGLDLATLSFINNQEHNKVLELGGGYGFVMIKKLTKMPSVEYHLNDLDERHLFIAANNLQRDIVNKKIPLETSSKVKFISGDITAADFVGSDKYDAILVGRVLHFFSPQQLARAIDNIKAMLNENGKVYIIATTPYVKRFKSFIIEYEKRLATGTQYPGYVTSLHEWLDEQETNSTQNPPISKGHFMFLDDRFLADLFSKAGFKIIECKTEALPFKSPAWELDGRENVVLIAQKMY